MATDIIKQAEPHIREIVRICRVLDADGGRTMAWSGLRMPAGSEETAFGPVLAILSRL
jgi:hypothetical protein